MSQTTYYNAIIGQPEETTAYLFDNQNHTGYAQVLEQTVRDAAQQIIKQLSFTLGLDVTAQASLLGGSAASAAVISHLLYDAHGSTRALADALAAIAQRYTYDAYGTHLTPTVNGNTNYFATAASALTQLLYSGEFTQPFATGAMQYLRARWYEPGSGRFMRVDPFSGLPSIPLSLNKFAYAHSNPIYNTDPSGQILPVIIGILWAIGIITTIGTVGYAGYRGVVAVNGLLDANEVATDIRRMADQGLIDPIEALELRDILAKESVSLLQELGQASADAAAALATHFIYGRVFAAVTGGAISGLNAGYQALAVSPAGASLAAGASAISVRLLRAIGFEGHHVIFKSAVAGGIRQSKYYLPKADHTGPNGIHALIAAKAPHLVPRGPGDTMQHVLRRVGPQKWLDDLGETYKQIEAEDSRFIGIYNSFVKAFKQIDGVNGLNYI